ncbi:hypothetical protein D3C73_605770 [compost metagenome]
MNAIFIISFMAILGGTYFFDFKRLSSQKLSMKVTYYCVTAVTVSLFACKLLRIHVPLPQRFFIHTVSPWVSRMVGL